MVLFMLLTSAGAAPEFTTFAAPGYDVPVSGVWYQPGQTTSDMPLGTLGTGFVDFTAGATFGAATMENNWLSPRAVSPECGFRVTIGGKLLELFPGRESDEPLRFWGHVPAADVDFGDTFGEVKAHLRAFTPLIPHDYEASNLPVALFHFTITNHSEQAASAEVAMHWDTEEAITPAQPASAANDIAVIPADTGEYAIGGRGDGWSFAIDAPEASRAVNTANTTILAGQRVEVVFALAWHFPEWTSSDGERVRNRYAAHHAGAAEVVAFALPKAADYERRVIAWQEKIYRQDVPPTLKDAVINSLYVMLRNSWWLADGRFFQSESFTGCPITETVVCRFNGTFPLALLWPECERATMNALARAQLPSGEIPFAYGRPAATRSPYYQVQHPIVSSEFALLAYRNGVLWQDQGYLKQMYAPVRKALQYAMTLDKTGDGLVNEDPGNEEGFPANQYYDIWPWWGVSAYTGSIWLAALRAGEEMAKFNGDTTFASELRQWFERGSRAFEEKLWTGEYYRLYNAPEMNRRSETSLTNALCGQWFAYACGLGDIVPPEHIDSVIDTVLRLNAKASPYGAVNGVRPDGSIDTTFAGHSAAMTIGEVWNFCAMAAFAGRAEEAVDLFNTSYANVALGQRTSWNIPWSLKPDTGGIGWGINYYSNPCVWTLYQALAPEAYAALAD